MSPPDASIAPMHLALPVADLAHTRLFHGKVLGYRARENRSQHLAKCRARP